MTNAAITLAAHAKINLSLRIGPRQPDGFHQVETLFQRIDLADHVSVRVGEGPSSLTVAWDCSRIADLGPPDRNLAWRAAAAYRDATSWPRHWHIHIVKRIPAGAGLGGGSADAAAVLRALDQLAPKPVGASKLAELAATLGSDVPFLAGDASLAIGRGRGERLQPLPALPHAHVALFVPPFAIDTAAAYYALDAWRDSHGVDAHSGVDPAAAGHGSAWASWRAVAAGQVNDFESPIFAVHPALGAARRAIEEQGALVARLSGSGSTVFGLWTVLPPQHAAHEPDWHVIAAKTM